MNTESLPLILDPAMLSEIIPGSNLLIIAVMQSAVFDSQHIPGSILVQPAELLAGIKPAVGKLPHADQLSTLFSRIGLSADKQVIVYDDEGGGWAGRFIWTLDVIGHRRYSYLDGGLPAWLKRGLPLSNIDDINKSRPTATIFSAQIDSALLVTLEAMQTQISNPDSLVWDARSEEEYRGTKITAQRNGHIPGAVNLNWLELQDRENDLRLKPLADIANQLQQLGISKDKRIITHCLTHHRSGLAYLVGKALGYDIRAYDGSWSEWGNHPDTPIAN